MILFDKLKSRRKDRILEIWINLRALKDLRINTNTLRNTPLPAKKISTTTNICDTLLINYHWHAENKYNKQSYIFTTFQI